MTHLAPTQAAGAALFARGLTGPVVMLNLLRFRKTADYTETPALAPSQPITGAQAFRRYIDHTLPYLRASGGDLLFYGTGGPWLIGPEGECWDAAMLVRQASVAAFMAHAQDPATMAGHGHRTAALRDSRLLPLAPRDPLADQSADKLEI